jgi:hypothetical protein
MNEYKQLQFIKEDDVRTFEQRMAALPAIRDEDFPEWKEWAEQALLSN